MTKCPLCPCGKYIRGKWKQLYCDAGCAIRFNPGYTPEEREAVLKKRNSEIYHHRRAMAQIRRSQEDVQRSLEGLQREAEMDFVEVDPDFCDDETREAMGMYPWETFAQAEKRWRWE